MMSFRRDGKRAHVDHQRWSTWLTEHADLIAAAGLPPDVTASEDKFAYFIDYTYNEDGYCGKAPWCSATDLTPHERRALWMLVQAAFSSLWTYPHEYSRAALERTYGPSSSGDAEVD